MRIANKLLFPLLVLLVLILAGPAWANQRAQGDCMRGNNVVVTSGLSSTTKVMQSFPSCTVTVFITQTSTLATLFSDNLGTPLSNPFTSDSSGHWFWYAVNGRYDTQLSGGGLGAPYTLGDILLADPLAGPGFTPNLNPASTNSLGQIVAATVQGNGAKVQLSTGATVTGDAVSYDANGNVVDTPVQGNGTKIQRSNGTTTNGHAAVFDANGNTIDSGSAPVVLPSAGAQLQYLRTQPNTGNNNTLQFFSYPEVWAADYNFPAQTPGGTLTSGIGNTVTLAPCPLGVNGSSARYHLYVSGGTGTAEAVLLTGGTCTPGLASGTVIFTPANNHSGAWTIASASGGIEEARTFLLSTGVGGGAINVAAGNSILIQATIVLPTTISLIGQGGSTASGNQGGTVLTCVLAASPCIAIADGLGTATNQGMGVHRGYQLYGAAGGTGLWIGGDPSSVFAPSAWTGSYTRYENIDIQNFATALAIRHGNFLVFDGCSFGALTLALLIPADQGGQLQPVDFYGTLLSSGGATAVEMDSNASLSTAIRFHGGQIAGALTGLGLNWESIGTHYEPNITNSGIVSVSAPARVVIIGGIIAVHGTALNSAISMTGSVQDLITVQNAWVQADSGMTVTNFVGLGSTVGGYLTLCDNNIAQAGTFTNLFSAVPTVMQVRVCPNTTYNASSTISAAASLVLPGSNLGYPQAMPTLLIGGTLGGSGITSISGVFQGQSGTLSTASAQTFTAGATIGNTLTTTAGLPYTWFFDGAHFWIK